MQPVELVSAKEIVKPSDSYFWEEPMHTRRFAGTHEPVLLGPSGITAQKPQPVVSESAYAIENAPKHEVDRIKEPDTCGWRRIPADGQGYIDSQEFLTWPDARVRDFIEKFEFERYGPNRNWNNLWRATLGLDTTRGKRVLDFGCGFGIEALQFAKNGNDVLLADIHPSNVKAAERVLAICGYRPAAPGKVDVWYSNGVLHHTPRIREILQTAVSKLNTGGEIRLLLYSDRAWTLSTSVSLPPIDFDITQHPDFPRYTRNMDSVGEYADWYNQEKLKMRVGDFLSIDKFTYITQTGAFATAILKPKETNG